MLHIKLKFMVRSISSVEVFTSPQTQPRSHLSKQLGTWNDQHVVKWSIQSIPVIIIQMQWHTKPAAKKAKYMSIQIKTIMYNCRLGSIRSKTASKGYELDPLSAGIVSVLVASLGAGSFSLEAGSTSTKEGPDWKGFLNCTKIIVMLSHPSPPAVEGAKHLSRTLSHTAESLLSYKSNFLRQFVF